ncbi:hypothetical protein MED01_003930 [Micromonospora sp. MED01]|uniref:hypothetical protein n=1 Tax=Micromonospora alfalfae TaxID=2911212 RepID=UPI001EE980AD|nr:hypothetical protein [Micromonospora alfalfae]MCG5465640.1 hypothetical protein [Micromonospora alfalfae]
MLYRGYGALLAASGVVTALVSYQVSDLSALPVAADDIAAMVEQVRADPRVDPERVVLWFFSGGGLSAADWLRVPPPWLRADVPAARPVPAANEVTQFGQRGGGLVVGRGDDPQNLLGVPVSADAGRRSRQLCPPGPLAFGPWTGFALFCLYTVIVLGLAAWQLRRRDA